MQCANTVCRAWWCGDVYLRISFEPERACSAHFMRYTLCILKTSKFSLYCSRSLASTFKSSSNLIWHQLVWDHLDCCEKRVHNAGKNGDLFYCCPTQTTVNGKMTATECGSILGRCQARKSGGGDGGGVSIWAVVRILACVFLKAIMFVCLLACVFVSVSM